MTFRTLNTKKLLGTVLLISFLSSSCSTEQQAAAPEAISVKLTTLERATLIDSTEYVGTLEAIDRVELAPKINGRILQIFVKEGDIVKKGDRIALLEPTQQKEDVNAAIANIQVQKASFNSAEAQLRQREAERARAAADVEEARADVQDAEADLVLAKKNYRRAVFLEDEDVVPTQTLDDRIREQDSALASLESQKEVLNSRIKSLLAAEKAVQSARANVDEARAAVARAEGQKGAIEQELVYNTMYAPIPGRVGEQNFKKVGDYLDLGETFINITNNDVFLLNVNIPTEFLPRLRIGLPVEMIKPDGSPGLRGEVSFINPFVDQSTQSVLAKFTFRNDGTLKDDQYVRVRTIWDKKPGLLIPTTAVTSLGGQRFVFVAKPGESQAGEASLVAKQIPIRVGTIQGQSYQVISGVKEGDRIALDRILDLKDDTPIVEATTTSQLTQ